MKIKHPDVVVKLVGQNSNTLNLLSIVERELRRAGKPQEDIELVQSQVWDSRSFEEALGHMMAMVKVE